MKRRLIWTFVALLVLATAAFYVIAADPQDAQSTTGQAGTYGTPASNAVAAAGGNVTEVNVSSVAGTSNWQGFWGNVSGSLNLGDGANMFYTWAGTQFAAVYASPDNGVDWTTVSGLNAVAAKEGKDTDYGLTSGEADSINRTMTGNTCAAGTEISAAAGVTPFDNGGSPSSWETCLAEDSGATVTDTVLGTNIVAAGAEAYNGLNVQFQLMVPVEAAGTNYYFYLELE